MNNTEQVKEILKKLWYYAESAPIGSQSKEPTINGIAEQINALYQQEVSADVNQLIKYIQDAIDARMLNADQGAVCLTKKEAENIITALTPTASIESECQFESDNGTSATKCKHCGREKWEHTHTSFPCPTASIESEQCKHEEKLMQGDGFVYTVCAKCGEDLDTIESEQGKEWISVEDRLPEVRHNLQNFSNDVLVWDDENGIIQTAFYHIDDKCWRETFNEIELSKVTKWRELPNPPDQSKSTNK